MRLACYCHRLLHSVKLLLPEAVLEEIEKLYEVGKYHKSPNVFSLIAERLQVFSRAGISVLVGHVKVVQGSQNSPEPVWWSCSLGILGNACSKWQAQGT